MPLDLQTIFRLNTMLQSACPGRTNAELRRRLWACIQQEIAAGVGRAEAPDGTASLTHDHHEEDHTMPRQQQWKIVVQRITQTVLYLCTEEATEDAAEAAACAALARSEHGHGPAIPWHWHEDEIVSIDPR